MTLIEYDPRAAVGRRRPPVIVSVAVPDAPAIVAVLSAAARGGVVPGVMAPFVRVTLPTYPFEDTTIEATPDEPAGQAPP